MAGKATKMLIDLNEDLLSHYPVPWERIPMRLRRRFPFVSEFYPPLSDSFQAFTQPLYLLSDKLDATYAVVRARRLWITACIRKPRWTASHTQRVWKDHCPRA